jgi:hypothetical protein
MSNNPYRTMCADMLEAFDGLPCETNYRGQSRPIVCIDEEPFDRARALLAQPEPKDPTDEELTLTYAYAVAAAVGNKRGPYTTEDAEAAQLAGLRAVLAKWGHPTPQPVPVSERLPGAEDCLDEGWAWFFNQRIGWRQAVLPVSPGYTHWLPANALPTPEALDD